MFRNLLFVLLVSLFCCDLSFAYTAKSAILSWKFPTSRGIVCEGDKIIKWDVSEHPEMPTDAEMQIWETERIAALANAKTKEDKLKELGDIFQSLSEADQAELEGILKTKSPAKLIK